MKPRRHAAFTLVELLIAACISSAIGLVLYGVATEGLVAFARNASINRSYTNARQTLDRIAVTMQSAGHPALLVDATGADTTATRAAGIRFWRYTSAPLYYLTAPTSLTATKLTVSRVQPGTASTLLPIPAAGDMITIAVLGFQAPILSVDPIVGNSTDMTVNFTGTLVSYTSPTLTTTALASATTAAAASVGGKMSCLDWTSVAFIAVNNEMRYFPKFISGTTSVSTAANYRVLAYLTPTLAGATTPLPFSSGPAPSVNVDLYAQSPDYSNRSTGTGTMNLYNGVSTADSYTYLQTALSPRCAAIMRSPY